MAKKKATAELTGSQKWRKWWRLVLLLTFKKYGGKIIGQIYFAFLLGAAVGAMDDIWGEFARVKKCEERFLKSVTSSVTESYSDAAKGLARSVVGKSRCILETFDFCAGAVDSAKGVVKVAKDLVGGKRRLQAGCAADGFVGPVFGWTAPGQLTLPQVNMTIESNTEEVMQDVQDDISSLSKIGEWTKYAGLILAALSILFIMFTATRYTFFNKAWKPSRITHGMRLLGVLRLVLAYLLAGLVIFLQAYSTHKFCGVSIESVTLDLPDCEVNGDCDFDCETVDRVFPNTCEQCHIKLHWWWVDVFALPNILLALYILFTLIVCVFECTESRRQQKELKITGKGGRPKKDVRKDAKKENPKQGLVSLEIGDSAQGDEENKQDSPNVLDGPASFYMKEPERETELQPDKGRYESAVYIYPEVGKKGGFY
ncbi:hypothetical protein BSKO_09183 [Bryopsis sp. KO-2023]|nr:hypothetical protein BSKO_09183 [Bryopsis sp. KO-2023]